jgi:hypothetical protein
MIHEPAGANLAVRLTKHHVNSARPDAPVVPERAPTWALRRARERAANGLRSVAARIDPATSSHASSPRPQRA